MIHFGDLSLAAAKSYRDLYAAAIPTRQRWLAQELRAQGQDSRLLADPSHLPQLWAWATNLIDSGPTSVRLMTPQRPDDPQPGIRPPWHDQESPNPFLSDGVLWLIELLGAHLATLTCLALPGAHWDVYRAHRRRSNDVFQHRTKLFGTSDPLGSDPSRMIYTAVIGHVYHRKPWSQRETLASLYDFMLRGTRLQAPHPT